MTYFRYRRIDWFLLGLVLLIAALGVMEIYSATYRTKFAGAHEKQVYWILGGLVLMFLLTLVDYHALMEQVPLMYLVSLGLLAAVLFAGRKALGARRWIHLFGGVNFQVSEFVKLVIILAMARYFSETRQEQLTTAEVAKVGAIVGDRKSTRLNSSHIQKSRMPSSA